MHLSSVLATTDFSADSVRAARLALGIARRHSAQLTLLHVDQLPAVGERMAEHVGPDVWQAYLGERNVALRVHLNQIAADLGPGAVQIALARDAPAAAIVQHAAEHRADLVVVAPHGRGASTRYLLGSVSFDVASEATCPVLVARHDEGFVLPESGAFQRVLVAVVDESSLDSALDLAVVLAAPGASLDLTHVIELREPLEGPPLPAAALQGVTFRRSALREALKRARESLRKQGFSVSIHMQRGDPADILLEPLAAKQDDLVIAAARSRRRLGAPGAVTQRLLRHSPVPVGIVPYR